MTGKLFLLSLFLQFFAMSVSANVDFRKLHRTIRRNLNFTSTNNLVEPKFKILINQDGSLGDIKVLKSSNTPGLDNACLEAIKKSFPIADATESILLEFTCTSGTLAPVNPNQSKLMQEIMNKAVQKISFAVDLPEHWPVPAHQAKVNFLMTIEGVPMNIYIAQTSGNLDYDSLIVKAIIDSQPYDTKGLEEDFNATFVSSKITKVSSNPNFSPSKNSVSKPLTYKSNGLLEDNKAAPTSKWHFVPTLDGFNMIKSD
jgi:TonB family protein